MTQNSTPPKTNWQSFAEEALDLWQTQLASTAADPKAREDMARLVSPFSQMFADWSTAMQQAQKQAQNAPGDTNGTPDFSDATTTANTTANSGRDHAPVDATSPETPTEPSPATNPFAFDPTNFARSAASVAPETVGGHASAAGGGDVAQLALRLAGLEQKMDLLLDRMSEFDKAEQRARRLANLAQRTTRANPNTPADDGDKGKPSA